jgi:hypothetical protein
MNELDLKSKLIIAMMQVENLIKLVEGNEYEKFFVSHLIPLKCELKRQLTNLNYFTKIKE